MDRRAGAAEAAAGGKVRIGVMGGTFDPIHYGHLVTAESARVKFSLDKVVFVPAGQPPHKTAGGVSEARHRYLMTVLATVMDPNFEVSRIEIDRPGPSHTADTLRLMRAEKGDSSEFYFITGADAVLEMMTWYNPGEILSQCQVIAATRPGYSRERLHNCAVEMARRFGHRPLEMEVPALAISSSDIRRRVSEGEAIRYLLPDAVESYIRKSRLYTAV